MAEYREHYGEMTAAGASVAAVSVDAPLRSEELRMQLGLPFPILCDVERRVVKEWGIYNGGEKGGIAKPSVFVIDASGVIRFAAVDSVARRVPAEEIVVVLRDAGEGKGVRRRFHIPQFAEWKLALGNAFRR